MTAEAMFLRVLTMACDRLFMAPVELRQALRHASAETLYQLSVAPEQFAPLNPSLDAARRREEIAHVLTAARAYALWHQRTSASSTGEQTELPLS